LPHLVAPREATRSYGKGKDPTRSSERGEVPCEDRYLPTKKARIPPDPPREARSYAGKGTYLREREDPNSRNMPRALWWS